MNWRKNILFIFLLSFFNTFSQSENRDWKILNSYSEKLNELESLSDYLGEEELINKALSLALKLKADSLISDFYSHKAIFKLTNNSFEKALLIVDSSISYAHKSFDVDRIINVYNTKGFIFQSKADYVKSIEWYYKALYVIDSSGNDQMKYSPLVNISTIYINNGEYKKAKDVLLEALKAALQSNNRFAVLACYQSLGVVFQELKNYSKAEYYYNKLLVLSKKLSRLENEADAYYGLAAISLSKKDFDQAKIYCQNSFDIYTSINSVQSKYLAYYNNAVFHYKVYEESKNEGDLKYSIEYIDSAYHFAMTVENYDAQKRILEKKAAYYEEAGYLKEAIETFKTYMDLKEELYGIDKDKVIKGYEAQYNAIEKKNEITNLNLKNKISKEKAGKLQYVLFGVILLSVFIGILLLVLIRSSRTKRKNILIKLDNETERHKLEFELFKVKNIKEKLEVVEIERDKLSRELHDNIAGKIFLVKNKICQDDSKTQNELSKLDKSLRKVITNLSKPIFEDVVSLHESLSLFLRESAGTVEFKLDVVLTDESRLSEELKFDLYRICQELVVNALKYANATIISIAILEESSSIELIVKDNGVGFTSNGGNGRGYSNIQLRLKKYDAEFKKETNQGAEITIKINKDVEEK